MEKEVCFAHSGVMTDIKNLKEDIKELKEKQDKILARVTATAITVVVALLALLGNIFWDVIKAAASN